MSSIRRCWLLILLIAGLPGWCQEDLSLLLQPRVSLNYAVTPAYFHNFSVAQRLSYLNLGEENLAVRNIDLTHFSNFKLGIHASAGLGILYRIREAFEGENTDEIRFTEQYNHVSRPGSIRFGHRFRVEQRVFPSRTLHRFRYRFALDGPLEGKKLDPGELYWIGSLEGLLTAGRGLHPLYSFRTSGWLGYLASRTFKIQVGSEYRIVNLWKGNRPVLFLLTSLVFNL
jgi:hypothetical protein